MDPGTVGTVTRGRLKDMTCSWSTLALACILTQSPPGAWAGRVAADRPPGQATSLSGQVRGGGACPAGEGTRVDAPFGIAVCQGTARVAVRMATDLQAGARVASVVANSAAARAGLATSDVVYLVNGVRVESGADALALLARRTDNNPRLQLNFWRDGLPFIVRIPVESR